MAKDAPAPSADPGITWSTERDDNDNVVHIENGEKKEWTLRHGAVGKKSCWRCQDELDVKKAA